MTTPGTRTAIRTMVRTMINEPSARFISDAEINAWIDDATKDISMRTFCGTLIATGMATVANQQQYAWPAVYGPGATTTAIYTLGIKTILNSSGVSLEYIPMDMIGRVGLETNNMEMKWSTWQSTIFFSPVPTAIYTFTPIVWVACHITASGTVPRLPEVYHHLVPLYCMSMAREKRRDYETAQAYWQRYESVLDRLVNTITRYDTWIDGRQKIREQAPT